MTVDKFLNFFGNIFSSFWGFLFNENYAVLPGLTLGSIIIGIIFVSILLSFFMRGGK